MDIYEALGLKNKRQKLTFIGLDDIYDIYCYNKILINIASGNDMNISFKPIQSYTILGTISDQLFLSYNSEFKIVDENNVVIYHEIKTKEGFKSFITNIAESNQTYDRSITYT